MISLFDIFFTFAGISSITFTGGMGMFPILEKEIVEKKKWITEQNLLDYYAISQGLPGIIAVNVASLIGYRVRGVKGTVIAALSIASPCLIVMLIVSYLIKDLMYLEVMKYAANGITIAVAALIFDTVITLWRKSALDLLSLLILGGTFSLALITNISPILFIIFSGSIASVYYYVRQK